MITTNTGAKKLEASDNWREIFPNPDLSTAGAHNASVDAADRIQPEIAPIINGKQCALGAASGDYVLLRNSTITGKSDGAYIAAKAIPANTDIDSTYLGNAITGGISNSLNNKITPIENRVGKSAVASGTNISSLSVDISGFAMADTPRLFTLLGGNYNNGNISGAIGIYRWRYSGSSLNGALVLVKNNTISSTGDLGTITAEVNGSELKVRWTGNCSYAKLVAYETLGLL